MEAAVLQVPEPAVNQLGGNAACSGGEISFLDQPDPQAAQHRIKGDSGPGNAATDNENIKASLPKRIDGPLHPRILNRPARFGSDSRLGNGLAKITPIISL